MRSIDAPYRNPNFILEEISRQIKEGEFYYSMEKISAYISNRYGSHQKFARSLGVEPQNLRHMLNLRSAEVQTLIKCLDRIWEDSKH